MHEPFREGTNYGEREIGAILRRAADLQNAHDQAGRVTVPGLTLEELEQAAADVGIDPRFLRAAVSEQEQRLRPRPRGVLELRRDVPVEVTDETWHAMIVELHRAFGKPGESRQIGDTYLWQLRSDPDPHTRPQIEVLVHPRSGGSEIELRAAVGHVFGWTWFGAGLVSLLVTFITLAAMVPGRGLSSFGWLVLPILLSAPILTGAGLALNLWRRRDRQKLNRVMDLLQLTARANQQALVSQPLHIPAPAVEPEFQRVSTER